MKCDPRKLFISPPILLPDNLTVCISFIHCLDCAFTARPWLLLLLLLYLKRTRALSEFVTRRLVFWDEVLNFFFFFLAPVLSSVQQLILNWITVNKSDFHFPVFHYNYVTNFFVHMLSTNYFNFPPETEGSTWAFGCTKQGGGLR